MEELDKEWENVNVKLQQPSTSSNKETKVNLNMNLNMSKNMNFNTISNINTSLNPNSIGYLENERIFNQGSQNNNNKISPFKQNTKLNLNLIDKPNPNSENIKEIDINYVNKKLDNISKTLNEPIENKADVNLNFNYFNSDINIKKNRKTNSNLNKSNYDDNFDNDLVELQKESRSNSTEKSKSRPNSKKKIDIFNYANKKGSLNSSKSKSMKSTKLNNSNKGFQIYNQDNFSCNMNNLRSQNFSINYQNTHNEVEENKILKKIKIMYSEIKKNDIRNKIFNDNNDNSIKSMHKNFYQLLSSNIVKNNNSANVNNKILTLRNCESKHIIKKIESDTKEIKLLDDRKRNAYNYRNKPSLNLLGVNNMNDIRLSSAEKRLNNILKNNNI